MPGVRVDSGVAEGGEVTVHYDPLVAKVIATAETRDLAIARLGAALRSFPILGLRTNIPFLLRIVDHARFRAGEVDTAFLDGEDARLAESAEIEMPAFVRAALDDARRSAGDSRSSTPDSRLATAARQPLSEFDPWTRLRAWRA